MKLHKFVVYAFDFENLGPTECQAHLDSKYLIERTFYNGSVDIGEWSDEHELNQTKSNQLTFDRYFGVPYVGNNS
jgi:hypothetical protein